MKNLTITRENFNRAWNNQRLVAGALKRAHIMPHYNNYEDLLHEGVFIYAKMMTRYADKPAHEVDKLSFNKIVWFAIDQMRKQQRRQENTIAEENAFNLAEKEIDCDLLVELKNLAKDLNHIKRVILVEHLLSERTISSLVEECGVSRKTLQRTKSKLLHKLRTELQR